MDTRSIQAERSGGTCLPEGTRLPFGNGNGYKGLERQKGDMQDAVSGPVSFTGRSGQIKEIERRLENMMVSRRNSGLETALAPGVMRSVFSGWVLSLILSAGLLAPLLAQQVGRPERGQCPGGDPGALCRGLYHERVWRSGADNRLGLFNRGQGRKDYVFPERPDPRSGRPRGRPRNVRRIQAETIRFTQDALKVARTITSRVEPRETPK